MSITMLPGSWEIILHTVRVEGAFSLFASLIGMLMIMIGWTRLAHALDKAKDLDYDGEYEKEIASIVIMVLVILAGVGLLMTYVQNAAMGLLDPEGVAFKIVQKSLESTGGH